MLAQERFERILEILREKQSVTVVELTEKLNTSESTIRRDLTELNRQGLLIKVHGGATAIKSVLSREEEVITKSKKHQEEKRKIAKVVVSGRFTENHPMDLIKYANNPANVAPHT